MREVTLAMAAAAAEVPPDQLCENFCLRPSHLAGALYLHYSTSTCFFQGKVNSFYNDLPALLFD